MLIIISTQADAATQERVCTHSPTFACVPMHHFDVVFNNKSKLSEYVALLLHFYCFRVQKRVQFVSKTPLPDRNR